MRAVCDRARIADEEPPVPIRSARLAAFSIFPLLGAAAPAQDADAPALAIRLDSLAQVEGTCRVTFVAENGLGSDIAQLVVEAVAFDVEGGVARLSLLDFGELQDGRPRMRQFDMPDMVCDGIGALLFNGVQTCEGADDCAARLTVSSRAEIELLG
jgi:hypothetical protein